MNSFQQNPKVNSGIEDENGYLMIERNDTLMLSLG